ncbi:MAG: HEPN domain-containing protein, partial [Alphaproteobacteria bacterium]|nr:HEPN domain-containing protein [Alphaproteobacteria bacterium]
MTEIKTPNTSDLRAQFDRIFQGERCRDYQKQVAHNNTRMYRALSWLERSEDRNLKKDSVERFVFLWLSFNAAYGNDLDWKRSANWERLSGIRRKKEIEKIKKFLRLVAENDSPRFHLAEVICIYKDAFEKIMEIRFLFRQFWQAAYEKRAWLAWLSRRKNSASDRFCEQQRSVQNALQNTLPPKEKIQSVLVPTFERIYILRNQIFHGASTYGGRFNRSSLEPANAILGACVPEILKIMLETMENRKDTPAWGHVEFPPFLKKPDDETDKNPPQR